jgi:hypothetical protein
MFAVIPQQSSLIPQKGHARRLALARSETILFGAERQRPHEEDLADTPPATVRSEADSDFTKGHELLKVTCYLYNHTR